MRYLAYLLSPWKKKQLLHNFSLGQEVVLQNSNKTKKQTTFEPHLL